MPNLIESKGRAKSPSYYKGGNSSSSNSSSPKSSKIPILIGVVAVGAGAVLFMRSKSAAPSNTGPALTLVPSGAADQSTITNMLQALHAINGMQSDTPAGGTGTPITGVSNPHNTPSPNFEGGPVYQDGQSLGNGLFAGPGGQVLDRVHGTVGGIDTNSRTGLPPGGIQTVGPLSYPGGITDSQRAAADSRNMSLVDWIKYQYAKTGSFVGLYGPNAGAPQQALDAAGIAAAKQQLGVK